MIKLLLLTNEKIAFDFSEFKTKREPLYTELKRLNGGSKHPLMEAIDPKKPIKTLTENQLSENSYTKLVTLNQKKTLTMA